MGQEYAALYDSHLWYDHRNIKRASEEDTRFTRFMFFFYISKECSCFCFVRAIRRVHRFNTHMWTHRVSYSPMTIGAVKPMSVAKVHSIILLEVDDINKLLTIALQSWALVILLTLKSNYASDTKTLDIRCMRGADFDPLIPLVLDGINKHMAFSLQSWLVVILLTMKCNNMTRIRKHSWNMMYEMC